MLACLTEEEEEVEESQKIDDLPILATHQFCISAMLSSKVNGPVAHGSMPDMACRGL